jgi:hypothetical protein
MGFHRSFSLERPFRGDSNKQSKDHAILATNRSGLEKDGRRTATGINPNGKLAQDSGRNLFVNDQKFRPDNQGRYARFIDRTIVMPRACRALLIIEGIIVMVNCCKNGAHAQVEQAQDCCNRPVHSDDLKVRRKNRLVQAELKCEIRDQLAE